MTHNWSPVWVGRLYLNSFGSLCLFVTNRCLFVSCHPLSVGISTGIFERGMFRKNSTSHPGCNPSFCVQTPKLYAAHPPACLKAIPRHISVPHSLAGSTTWCGSCRHFTCFARVAVFFGTEDYSGGMQWLRTPCTNTSTVSFSPAPFWRSCACTCTRTCTLVVDTRVDPSVRLRGCHPMTRMWDMRDESCRRTSNIFLDDGTAPLPKQPRSELLLLLQEFQTQLWHKKNKGGAKTKTHSNFRNK